MRKDSKITVFGSNGLVGSSMVRQLKKQEYTNLDTPSLKDVNLLFKEEVDSYFKQQQPKNVFMVAGLVGGILANMTRQADFLYQNTTMILNIVEAIKNFSPTTKILYTGSTCIYPRENPQPINENRFLAGPLEETNKGYAIAKITGIIACQMYRQQYGIKAISVMPANMYGPNDNYNLETGHAIPALIKKFVEAKKNKTSLTFWGTGNPRREALYVDDCTDACIYLMNNYDEAKFVNIGTGFDYSIKEFIGILEEVVGYKNEIIWDKSKPDGTFEKRTDITYLKSIMPEYSPRSFKEGVKEVLKHDFEFSS